MKDIKRLLEKIKKVITPLYMKVADEYISYLLSAKGLPTKELQRKYNKTEQELILFHSKKQISEKIRKEYSFKVEDISSKIIKKISTLDIENIELVETGYDMKLKIETPKGLRYLTIITIVAYGNIQRPHCRTLIRLLK